MAIQYVAAGDSGLWAVRPKSVVHDGPAVWCNFTLTVADFDIQEELQSDQADDYHYSSPRHPEEDFPPEDGDEEEVLGGIQEPQHEPLAPTFIRFNKMEMAQSVVKPAGSTVTYKCPANGNDSLFRRSISFY